jgi:hypothetical protein
MSRATGARPADLGYSPCPQTTWVSNSFMS